MYEWCNWEKGQIDNLNLTKECDCMNGIKNMLLGIAIMMVSIALASVLSYFLEYTALVIGACFVLFGYFHRDWARGVIVWENV